MVRGGWFLKFTCKRSFLLWRGFSFVFQKFLLYWDVLHRNEVVGKRFPLYIESHTENKRSEFKEPFHSLSCVSKARFCLRVSNSCCRITKNIVEKAEGRVKMQRAARLEGKNNSVIWGSGVQVFIHLFQKAARVREGQIQSPKLKNISIEVETTFSSLKTPSPKR